MRGASVPPVRPLNTRRGGVHGETMVMNQAGFEATVEVAMKRAMGNRSVEEHSHTDSDVAWDEGQATKQDEPGGGLEK